MTEEQGGNVPSMRRLEGDREPVKRVDLTPLAGEVGDGKQVYERHDAGDANLVYLAGRAETPWSLHMPGNEPGPEDATISTEEFFASETHAAGAQRYWRGQHGRDPWIGEPLDPDSDQAYDSGIDEDCVIAPASEEYQTAGFRWVLYDPEDSDSYFVNEASAARGQRLWRTMRGRDEMTGESIGVDLIDRGYDRVVAEETFWAEYWHTITDVVKGNGQATASEAIRIALLSTIDDVLDHVVGEHDPDYTSPPVPVARSNTEFVRLVEEAIAARRAETKISVELEDHETRAIHLRDESIAARNRLSGTQLAMIDYIKAEAAKEYDDE